MDGELARSVRAIERTAVILVVGPETGEPGGLRAMLERAGYLVRRSVDPTRACDAMAVLPPDLIIVDGAQTGSSVGNICRHLLGKLSCPILAIEPSADVIDRVLALELGADDCLSRPVHDREILARVKALIRRHREYAAVALTSTEGNRNWSLNLASREVTVRGREPVLLSPSEQHLLTIFLRQPGRPVRIDTLVQAGFLRTCSGPQLRTGVLRLRRKLQSAGLGGEVIRSIRDGGYLFDEELAATSVVFA